MLQNNNADNLIPDTQSEAYWDGMYSYNDSLDDKENPFQEGTQDYINWEAGYEQGRMDW